MDTRLKKSLPGTGTYNAILFVNTGMVIEWRPVAQTSMSRQYIKLTYMQNWDNWTSQLSYTALFLLRYQQRMKFFRYGIKMK